jgi:hypothetical protein
MQAQQDIGQIISDGPTSRTMRFGADLGVYQHTLHQSALFSDAALAQLLDSYPRESVEIYTVGADQRSVDKSRRGSGESLSGAQLLDAVKTGRIWMRLRGAHKVAEAYQQIADKMFAELHQMHHGLTTFSHDVGVIISSPGLQEFYEFDMPLTALFQVSGEKVLRVWDAYEPYIQDTHLETHALTGLTPAIEFNPVWNEDAQSVALKPGMMATWAQNSPYRLVNSDALNVALYAAFMTPAALLRANVIYSNAVMRRKFGMAQRLVPSPSPFNLLKLGLVRAAKQFNWYPPSLKTRAVSFHVEPAAPNAVREIAQAAA